MSDKADKRAPPQPGLIVITGPTATGKTALGALLAKSIGGEVVSADSMQVYEHMDIGTAKPSKAEMLGITHHLLSIVPPWEDYSVARYISDATECIDDILSRNIVPILVGGTGLYIDSLLSGREFLARGDTPLRRSLEEEYDDTGGEAMLRRLSEIDSGRAQRLHANDKKRIVRAFEVYEATGKTISQHDLETQALPPRYSALKAALTFSDRGVLYARIDKRVDAMVSEGLEQEVRSLLGMGVKPSTTAMQAIGYKEMASAILGECSMGEAVEKIKMESRRYAKRQLSWLRRDQSVNWIIFEKAPDIEGAARRLAEEYEKK
ncbi:MAG: tRNA (adenosine(37)-N6)-dimethylallyltransferase MiaA [Oscillospiraceae bacterium]|nr:tRNA (adenosine(37)-N6)-dimethylallyltransferase MiaA [Oscillospiraceae bacterium]